MEIRARYVQMGAFTLAVIVAAFGFVYWLNNAGGLRERLFYRVHFESPVSGLLRGSAVLFNGIRVGEVTSLDLDSDNPRQVRAIIAVDRGTPIRTDTKIGMDFQGLTGSPVIALTGGNSMSPVAARKGELPLLVADPAAGQSMSQAARDVLRRIDGVLAENAEPLHKMIASLNTFAGALARNSDRVDGIVAGLERMTGGAAAKARMTVYDLTVSRVAPAEKRALAVQLVVPDPIALAALDTDKIVSMSANGVASTLADAQWSDMLPKLLQMKIIRGFEDVNLFAGVNRPMEGVIGDFQLLIDIRKFHATVSEPVTADVEFAGKVLDNSGRIIATRIFRATAPAETAGAPGIVAALDQAFGMAIAELMPWTARAMGDHLERIEQHKPVAPKKAASG